MAIRAITSTPKPKAKGKIRIVAKNAAKAASEPPPQPSSDVSRDEGVMMVRRCRYVDGIMTHEGSGEARVPSPKFEGEVARTRVSLGCTKSLGNFEFIRIDVMVELPCNPNPQDIDETNEFASQKATEYMDRELATLVMPEPPALTHQRTNMEALHADQE